jgi:2-methylcitrate synthase
LGNGLNYRGYSIQDLAQNCIFEEVLYLLIFKKLPTADELAAVRKRIASMRGIPDSLKKILELIPANSNAMDVMRTISSLLGII